jgi:heme-degrading monooxygenase HmoA
MTVIVFRSRLVDDVPGSYGPRAAEMFGYATKMPGFRSFKQFTADDGERVSLIEFETEAQSRAWREHAEHRKAQQEGRDLYYAEFSLQVCEVIRESRFERER